MNAKPAAVDRALVTRVVREEYGRVVAALVRRFGDVDTAEDAVQEALLAAVERWTVDGLPPNPGGWLTTTATNKALDRVRRESKRESKYLQATAFSPTVEESAEAQFDRRTEEAALEVVPDERLRLIFTCCHPALDPAARVALTLRLLGGLTAGEIARAFLLPEATMAKRLTRAKAKIAANRIPYRVPTADDLPARLDGVLGVLYLVYNEGYLPGVDPVEDATGNRDGVGREDLAIEAIRLTRVVTALLPDALEATGLLALMLLSEARRPARFSRVSGATVLVPLPEQDRGRWDAGLIGEGHALVRRCLRADRPGPYQFLAAINAVHTDAATADRTDWRQILALYDQLLQRRDDPVIALNRAVAVAEVEGPLAALELVDALADRLSGYHAFHVTRADLLRRLGRSHAAREAYDAALAHAVNEPERVYLLGVRDALPA